MLFAQRQRQESVNKIKEYLAIIYRDWDNIEESPNIAKHELKAIIMEKINCTERKAREYIAMLMSLQWMFENENKYFIKADKAEYFSRILWGEDDKSKQGNTI